MSVKQAGISGAIGYTLGIIVSWVVAHFAEPAGAPVLLNWSIALGTLLVTLSMCVAAAMISINKVTRLDPATVFKG